ncbi:MAG: hypothetical protein QM727_04700 [Niabella sp.]
MVAGRCTIADGLPDAQGLVHSTGAKRSPEQPEPQMIYVPWQTAQPLFVYAFVYLHLPKAIV